MPKVLRVAVPCPLRQSFDYLAKEESTPWETGLRVKVPFGHQQLIGIVVEIFDRVEAETSKLKHIIERIDPVSVFTEELFLLSLWVSQYYHYPLGECFQTILPKQLRLGEADLIATEQYWRLSESGLKVDLTDIQRAKKQQQIFNLLKNHPAGLSYRQIKALLGEVRQPLVALKNKSLVRVYEQDKIPVQTDTLVPPCVLNDEQQKALEAIWEQKDNFSSFLLDGVTSSGKTEVYIHLTEKMIAEGKQVLILIPEIGLTTQFVARFRKHLDACVVVINSSLSDSERKQAWLLAREGIASVIIGTRSAVFTPFKTAGMIILDEEHDASYKQQDGLRYHARNVAMLRAKRLSIPILLGSATPSLESLYNVEKQRYQLLKLTQRAAGAKLPKIRLINTRDLSTDSGISIYLIQAIQSHLNAGNQVLLFINRRGFSPVIMCHGCGWQASCTGCDARMIVHKRRNILCCHHCGLVQRLPAECPTCKAVNLKTYGAGTEKIEQALQGLFPKTPVLRIDRDTTQRKNAFADLVAEISQGSARVLVGTQMLAKGHDFHGVTLVGVLDADQGLYSADFRATETLSQLITQVTGRAGRGEKAGEVLIQTEQPEHIFWQNLIEKGFQYTVKKLLQERISIGLPPENAWCVIRAEAKQEQFAMEFLTEVSVLLQQGQSQVILMGPAPAMMEKRAGRYRAQLLLTAQQRKPLHLLLDQHIDVVSSLKLARKVRWSIDIDPLDFV